MSVYFIQAGDGGPIKIGVTTDVQDRLSTLQIGSALPLVLLLEVWGGIEQERGYHETFAEHRMRGEWFAPHEDLLAFIEHLKENPPEPPPPEEEPPRLSITVTEAMEFVAFFAVLALKEGDEAIAARCVYRLYEKEHPGALSNLFDYVRRVKRERAEHNK